MGAYVPRKGDFVALTFDPQAGHEQKGRRPALIVSNDMFNWHTGMAIACPITNTDRNYPFHVAVGEGLPVTGFVMVDQVPLRHPRRAPISVPAMPSESGKLQRPY